MAASKEEVSFDAIIQADRQRRRNEALAQEIFGKPRRVSTPANGLRKPGSGPSLASRVGIAKASQRSTSSTPKPKAPPATDQNNSSPVNNLRNRPVRSSAIVNPMTRSPRVDQRNNRLYDALQRKDSNGASEGLSIRGLAGPYVVIGSNFAPGTTAADIESAMVPSNIMLQSCRILTSSPTVIAELVFADKQDAESVVATFNNKKADGRLLHIYLKTGASSAMPTDPAKKQSVTPNTEAPSSYESQREHYDRNRRRADPEFQDGSYGFDSQADQMEVDVDDRQDKWQHNRRDEGRYRDAGREKSYRPLYSDELYSRPRGRGFR